MVARHQVWNKWNTTSARVKNSTHSNLELCDLDAYTYSAKWAAVKIHLHQVNLGYTILGRRTIHKLTLSTKTNRWRLSSTFSTPCITIRCSLQALRDLYVLIHLEQVNGRTGEWHIRCSMQWDFDPAILSHNMHWYLVSRSLVLKWNTKRDDK